MSPMRNRVFRAFWFAQMAANIGVFAQMVGSVWLVGDLGGSPLMVALVQAATTAPVLLLGLPASALIDLVDRRRVLLVTQLWMLLAAAALATITWLDATSPWSLYALVLAQGIGLTINTPAWLSIQPDLVAPEQLSKAVALSSANGQVARAAGPAIGGALVAAGGPELAFVVTAVSGIGLLVVASRWSPRSGSLSAGERFVPAMRAGVRYSVYSIAMRRVLLRAGLYFFPAGALLALLPVVARDVVDAGATAYGLLLGAFGLSAVFIAFVLPGARERRGSDAVLVVAALAMGGTIVGIGHSSSMFVLVVLVVVAGAAWTAGAATMTFAAQRSLPPWVRARGLGLYLIVSQGGVALGSVVWGAAASRWSLSGSLTIAGIALGLGALSARRWPFDIHESLDLRPADPVPTGDLPVVAPHAGPVLVTVEYTVTPDQLGDFATVMERVERLRRRTGARDWSLWRDPSAAGRFVEMFTLDTWDELPRQRSRRTQTDRTVEASLLALVGDQRRRTLYVAARGDPLGSRSRGRHGVHPDVIVDENGDGDAESVASSGFVRRRDQSTGS